MSGPLYSVSIGADTDPVYQISAPSLFALMEIQLCLAECALQMYGNEPRGFVCGTVSITLAVD